MKTYPIRFAPDRQLFDSFAHDPSLIPVSFSLDGDDYRGFGSFALTSSEESTAKNGAATAFANRWNMRTGTARKLSCGLSRSA